MKSSFSALIIAMVILALAFAGYGALRAKVTGESVAVAGLTRDIEAKTAAAERLARVRETLASLAEEEVAIGNYFVPQTGVVAFIEELQSRGQSLGTTVGIASVGATPVSAKGRPRLLVSLTITGPFDAVVRTLGSIEYAPYNIKTTNLVLTRGEDKTWVAAVSLSVGSVSPGTSSTRAPAPASAPVPTPASTTPATSTPPLP